LSSSPKIITAARLSNGWLLFPHFGLWIQLHAEPREESQSSQDRSNHWVTCQRTTIDPVA